ncbi:thiamine diphosphokinase [Aquicoccus sp. G2-2]|uniref:thiamine diphosphokinase n=1 Tax=Aquicoccus sp. G2-2 TaxID=3092120 RepID=UPI002ADF577C|nr:thiamine diphosphokinase [Aquicoccus sp. G2-2]MEA1114194.1 thiamine diphosphokinase [Aquicoccus sp. G2-2]
MRPLTLVGGGKVKKSLLQAAIVHAPRVVAADGGAESVLRHGIMPEAVIGDFDSISRDACAAIPGERLHKVEEQDSTDFEKCLTRMEAPLIIGLGFGGGRLDHELAALHGLMRFPERRCLLVMEHDLAFLLPPVFEIAPPVGSRFSVFPLAEGAARSKGLRWALDGLALMPGRQIGTSNEVSGPVRIESDAPVLLAILPVEQFKQAVQALLAQGEAAGGWPAR